MKINKRTVKSGMLSTLIALSAPVNALGQAENDGRYVENHPGAAKAN